MNICVYGAASDDINKVYIKAGEQLGRMIAQKGHGLVFGGGACGLMGAAARGVFSEGGHITAVVPSFFNVDGALFEHSNKTVLTETMRERKKHLEEFSDAFIITPGGIGTFDEFFEIIALRSLKRHQKPVAVLNTLGFYDDLLNFIKKVSDEKFLRASIDDLIFVSDNVEEILNYITR